MAKQRIIDAPEQEWLDEKQSAEFLGIDVEDFRRSVRTGRFPFKHIGSRKAKRWNWKDLWCYSHMLERGCLSVPDEADDEDEEPEKRPKKRVVESE